VPSFDGGHQIQPVASVDVADAVVEALSRPAAGVVDAGGPNAVRFGALVDALCELLGKRRLNLTLPVGSISRLARALPGARRSRLVHSAAMLGTDRTVAPLPPQLIGRAPTDLRQGLQAALVNYGLQVARPDADL
jgi:uncharacterized protein YbjT (DUF2867 family)